MLTVGIDPREAFPGRLRRDRRYFRRYIGKYERDEMKPFIDTATRLAAALEVLLDYLVGQSETAVVDRGLLRDALARRTYGR